MPRGLERPYVQKGFGAIAGLHKPKALVRIEPSHGRICRWRGADWGTLGEARFWISIPVTGRVVVIVKTATARLSKGFVSAHDGPAESNRRSPYRKLPLITTNDRVSAVLKHVVNVGRGDRCSRHARKEQLCVSLSTGTGSATLHSSEQPRWANSNWSSSTR